MSKQVQIFQNLPEIYKLQDGLQDPPGQLQAFVGLAEELFEQLYQDIEQLHRDLFIESCSDWVIPYIGDLLGIRPIGGDPWVQRAEVAGMIALRRRKGTLAALQRLAYLLSGWPSFVVEEQKHCLRAQALNSPQLDHRPNPIASVAIGHAAALREVGTPFDQLSRTPSFRPPQLGQRQSNLPNLSVYFWRLRNFRIRFSQTGQRFKEEQALPQDQNKPLNPAPWLVQCDLHPLNRPIQLYTGQIEQPPASDGAAKHNFADDQAAVLADLASFPGPISRTRLKVCLESGKNSLLKVVPFSSKPKFSGLLPDASLVLHFPDLLPQRQWQFRSANLCAGAAGLDSPLQADEIAVDPQIGRVLIGLSSEAEANLLVEKLLSSHYLAAPGSTALGQLGAWPDDREAVPTTWFHRPVQLIRISSHGVPNSLTEALASLSTAQKPTIIELSDSGIYELNFAGIPGFIDDDGLCIGLRQPLILRAADRARPILLLHQPLRFRPRAVLNRQPDEAPFTELQVQCEGLYFSRAKGYSGPILSQAALDRLEFRQCTLEPGGFLQWKAQPAPIRTSLLLDQELGFSNPAERDAFDQTPLISFSACICGPLRIDSLYRLELNHSVVHAGSGCHVSSELADYAIAGTTADPADSFGPRLSLSGVTLFGRARLQQLEGAGLIALHSVEVFNEQVGCLRFSLLAGKGDRLPQHYGCLTRDQALIRFDSERFGQPEFARLSFASDWRIRIRGPGDDEMGAFGFLQETRKWIHLQQRIREFMPLAMSACLIPAT